MTSRLKVVAFGLVLMAVLALPAAAATPDIRTITVVGTGEMSLDAAIARDERVSLRGFEASTKIELALPDVQRAANVLDRVRAAGVTQIFGPVASEEVSKELARRALADGYDDAVEKAKRLAAKAGVTLGPALTIDERRTDVPPGPFFYGPGVYPRPEAPSRDVYATVTVTFAIS